MYCVCIYTHIHIHARFQRHYEMVALLILLGLPSRSNSVAMMKVCVQGVSFFFALHAKCRAMRVCIRVCVLSRSHCSSQHPTDNSCPISQEMYQKMLIYHDMEKRMMKQREDSSSAASVERRRAMVMMMTKESILAVHHISHRGKSRQRQQQQQFRHPQQLSATVTTLLWAIYRY